MGTFRDNTIAFKLDGYSAVTQTGVGSCNNPGVITDAKGTSSVLICWSFIIPDIRG